MPSDTFAQRGFFYHDLRRAIRRITTTTTVPTNRKLTTSPMSGRNGLMASLMMPIKIMAITNSAIASQILRNYS